MALRSEEQFRGNAVSYEEKINKGNLKEKPAMFIPISVALRMPFSCININVKSYIFLQAGQTMRLSELNTNLNF